MFFLFYFRRIAHCHKTLSCSKGLYSLLQTFPINKGVIIKIQLITFNKPTELLFVQLRLFDDWKEEFRSWANKSRSLAIGAGFAAMSNPAKKKKKQSKQ